MVRVIVIAVKQQKSKLIRYNHKTHELGFTFKGSDLTDLNKYIDLYSAIYSSKREKNMHTYIYNEIQQRKSKKQLARVHIILHTIHIMY